MNKEIHIGDLVIGNDHPPLVIAELSGNHNQSIDTAIEMIRVAAESGVQGIKLQTYRPDTMTVNSADPAFVIKDQASPWNGQNLYALYQQAYTPWEWHALLFEEAHRHGLIAFSTPFDISAVDFLETLNVPAYKIASFENTDLRLIRRVAATGKPVIISTGMATKSEINRAVSACREAGGKDLILLKCTSTYPAAPQNSHLRTIADMQQKFQCPVGLSDHTQGTGVAVAAVALGACLVEKHFVLDRASGGVDSVFSLEPAEMRLMVDGVQAAWKALGKVYYGPTEDEKASLKYRRGLYAARDLNQGEILDADDIASLRPRIAIGVDEIDSVLGKRVSQHVTKGTALSWDMIDN